MTFAVGCALAVFDVALWVYVSRANGYAYRRDSSCTGYAETSGRGCARPSSNGMATLARSLSMIPASRARLGRCTSTSMTRMAIRAIRTSTTRYVRRITRARTR